MTSNYEAVRAYLLAHSDRRGNGATGQDLVELGSIWGPLPVDVAAYLKEIGWATIGPHELFGLGKGVDWHQNLTERARELWRGERSYKVPAELLPFYDSGGGWFYCLSKMHPGHAGRFFPRSGRVSSENWEFRKEGRRDLLRKWRRSVGPMVMELAASSGRLVFRADAVQWCRVELTTADQVLQLGADLLTVVVERLLQGLRGDDQRHQAGAIDGMQVTWVLSLAEGHASIYSAGGGGMLVLFFQDADGRLIARLDLHDEDRRRWIATLEAEMLRASEAP